MKDTHNEELPDLCGWLSAVLKKYRVLTIDSNMSAQHGTFPMPIEMWRFSGDCKISLNAGGAHSPELKQPTARGKVFVY